MSNLRQRLAENNEVSPEAQSGLEALLNLSDDVSLDKEPLVSEREYQDILKATKYLNTEFSDLVEAFVTNTDEIKTTVEAFYAGKFDDEDVKFQFEDLVNRVQEAVDYFNNELEDVATEFAKQTYWIDMLHYHLSARLEVNYDDIDLDKDDSIVNVKLPSLRLRCADGNYLTSDEHGDNQIALVKNAFKDLVDECNGAFNPSGFE